MTAIAGIINLDGRSVDRAEIERVKNVLTSYGQDSQSIVRLGCSAFTKTLLRVTPEDRFDRQPFQHSETGVVFIFDGRLDNRLELERSIGMDPVDRSSVADGDVAFLG